jgi:ribosomal protein S18 acetylase RimI-like enzyme
MGEIVITRLDRSHTRYISCLNTLIGQLTTDTGQITAAHLQRVLQNESIHLLAAVKDDEPVGLLSLIIAPILTGHHAYIEDVVVDERHRGHGIAERLVREALDIAIRAGAKEVDLTSNPAREAANRLYQRLGFERRTTNVYRYTLSHARDASV